MYSESCLMNVPPPIYPRVTEAVERDRIDEIIPGRLLITNWRGAADLAELKRLGVTHIAAVGSEFVENDELEGILYWKKDIMDVEEHQATMRGSMRAGASFIQEALAGGGCCLVHCAAGCSRSATIVLAYLLLHGDGEQDLRSALVSVHGCRRAIWPNDGFMAALIALESEERGRAVSLRGT